VLAHNNNKNAEEELILESQAAGCIFNDNQLIASTSISNKRLGNGDGADKRLDGQQQVSIR